MSAQEQQTSETTPQESQQSTVADPRASLIKNCLTYGIFETAKKIQDYPDLIQMMLEYLIQEDLGEEATLLTRQVFGEEVLKQHESLLPEIDETFTRNQMVNKHHLALKGEKLADSRRRLRTLRK